MFPLQGRKRGVKHPCIASRWTVSLELMGQLVVGLEKLGAEDQEWKT